MRGLLRRLGALFGKRPASREDPHAIVFHLQCSSCGEVVRVRVDRRWDLVQELDDPATAWVLRKDVLGTRCNRMMSLHATFDSRYAIVSQEAAGGTFVDPQPSRPAPGGPARA